MNVVRADGARGRLDLLLRRVRAAEGDVVADRAAEQERLLRHDRPSASAASAAVTVAQVVAVDQHAPRRRVVEARHQLGHRRLARARRADERDGLSRRDVQVHVAEGLAGPVRERHVVELDLAAHAPQLDRVGRVAQLGLLVEQLEDLVQRRHPRLVGRVELRQRLDRVEEVVQRGDERHQHADRDLAVDRLHAAVEQDPGGRERRQQLDRREVGRVEVDGLHVRLAVLVVELREARQVALLLRERAHDPDARQRLLQVGGDRRDLLARERGRRRR